MKTLLTLSLLPLIVIAYFFSKTLYIAGDYAAAYTLIAMGFSSLVYFIYQASARLQPVSAYHG